MVAGTTPVRAPAPDRRERPGTAGPQGDHDALRRAPRAARAASRGLSSEQLAVELYGPGGSAVTARAELHRLRKLVAPWIATRPYRLVGGIRADFADARRLAERGDVARAHRRYAGPLFPSSQNQGIVRERRRLSRMLRRGSTPPSAL